MWDYWYFDGDDGSQEEVIDGQDHFLKNYGFEKLEEIGEAHRRITREKRFGYHRCFVCNIKKPGAVYLLLERMGYIRNTCNSRF